MEWLPALMIGAGAALLTALLAWSIRLRMTAALALLTSLGVLAVPAAAGATASSITVTSYLGATECTQTHIYISDAAYPHLDAYGAGYYTDHNNGLAFCNTIATVRFPAGYVRTREDLYMYDPEIKNWVACNYGPMVYNGAPSYKSVTGFNWGYPAACWSYDWYFGAGYGAIYNGGWQGGWHNTPNAVYIT